MTDERATGGNALSSEALDQTGVLDVKRPAAAAHPVDDRACYDEADFWAATERPRVRRRPRATEVDPDAAHLARERDLGSILHPPTADRATPVPGATPIVETVEDGSTLEYLFDRTLRIPREVRRRHLLVVGPTGCGKTTRAILPVLRGDIADPDLTVVVLDTKGELLPAARVFAEAYRPGQDVQVVQFRDPARSLGWNPLERVRTHTEAFELAHNLCHAVDTGREGNDSVFWINSSIDLLAAFFVALQRKFDGQASIADALRLCDLSVRDLQRFAREFQGLDVLERFASYIGTGSHNAETIIADLRMRLVLWRDENVAAVTSVNEVDLEGLCRTPTVLVLQVPEEDVEEIKPVTNAFLDQLLSTALGIARASTGLVLPVQMSIHIEEFASSVGRIPKFERRLNTVRQPGISITASVQTLAQIQDEYGSAFRSVMAGFSTKVVFADCLVEDAHWFSSMSGETTVIETTTTIEEDPLGLTRRIRSERPVQRPLLTPGELQRPPLNQMLGRAVTWFGPGLPPFQVFLTPLFMLETGGAQLGGALRLGALGALRAEALVDRRKDLMGVGGASSGRVPSSSEGITVTTGWTSDQIRERLSDVVRQLEFKEASPSARKWWDAFEEANEHRAALVLRLAEELLGRGATITEFFLAYVYSNTENIQANLHYLDYSRLKKTEERAKKEAACAERERVAGERGGESEDSSNSWFGVADEGADGLGRGASREETARHWLRRMVDEDWTLAHTARASGLTVGTLRYWRRKLVS